MRTGSPRSARGVDRCAAGRRGTITSAESALWEEAEQLPIRGGAAQRSRLARQADRNPADVSAGGAAGVLHDGAAGIRLRVDLAALEAADALQHRERDELACNRLHREKDARRRTNLRGQSCPEALVSLGGPPCASARRRGRSPRRARPPTRTTPRCGAAPRAR